MPADDLPAKTAYEGMPTPARHVATTAIGTARLTGQTLGAVTLASLFSLAGTAGGKGPSIGLGVAAGLAALASGFSTMRLRTSR